MTRRPLALALLVIAALVTGCGESRAPQQPTVRAADFQDFFLWAGVAAPRELPAARTVYLLAGEVRGNDNRRFVPLRPSAPRAGKTALWLVLRLERIDWEPSVTDQLVAELNRWSRAGNRVEGVQIDFDAATRGIADYARFLRALRQRLPADSKLSVTGLLDWGANADPDALADLVGVVDEVVVQTYQGRATIPGYARYVERLHRLPVPYRIGLVEGGEWSAPAGLESDPQFRGYVVFLTNRRAR